VKNTALVTSLLIVSLAARAQQRTQEELGVSGYVLMPDGAPVSGGTVMFHLLGVEATASIDRTGRFRLVPHAPGLLEMYVSAPGLAPYRARVAVPLSKTLTLPPIRLSPGAYFRVRFVSSAGEPITSPRIVRQSLDVTGIPIREPRVSPVPDQMDPDGTTTIGPLPRGVTTMVLDTPPLARTRPPDVRITAESTLVDGGTVIVEPGAVLNVDVVDGAGAPVPDHGVLLEDAVPLSPLMFPPARTDQSGRVTFDRLAAGRYRLRTESLGRCGDRIVSIARAVSVAGNGTVRTRLVIGGTARFRLTSSGVPLRAASITATPESAPSGLPPWLRAQPALSPFVGRPFGRFVFESPCIGTTDADGRVTLTNFPPGGARIDVRLPSSTWVRRLMVPSDGREVAIEVPGGFLPLRVSNAATGGPVAEAAVTWTSGGAHVEAMASASGEALLGGVAAAPGTLTIRTTGYHPLEVKLPEPPAVLHEVAVVPTRAMSLQCQVITESGAPLRNAVVALTPEDPMEVDLLAVTDEKGFARFFGHPQGALLLLARADGYVVSRVRIPADATSDPVLTLSRGYRVIARVESPGAAGPSLIRIVTEGGAPVDDLLDAASDRSIEAPGRVSLGPLPPGLYTIELHGPRERRQERVRVENHDVSVTFR
jgi:hypothetical protein